MYIYISIWCLYIYIYRMYTYMFNIICIICWYNISISTSMKSALSNRILPVQRIKSNGPIVYPNSILTFRSTVSLCITTIQIGACPASLCDSCQEANLTCYKIGDQAVLIMACVERWVSFIKTTCGPHNLEFIRSNQHRGSRKWRQ